MFLLLTALAILPDDFTDHALARRRTALGMRTRQLELLVLKTQRDVDRLYMELPRRPSLQPLFQANLDHLGELRMKLSQAHDVELRGPPFASAIWRARPAVKP